MWDLKMVTDPEAAGVRPLGQVGIQFLLERLNTYQSHDGATAWIFVWSPLISKRLHVNKIDKKSLSENWALRRPVLGGNLNSNTPDM